MEGPRSRGLTADERVALSVKSVCTREAFILTTEPTTQKQLAASLDRHNSQGTRPARRERRPDQYTHSRTHDHKSLLDLCSCVHITTMSCCTCTSSSAEAPLSPRAGTSGIPRPPFPLRTIRTESRTPCRRRSRTPRRS